MEWSNEEIEQLLEQLETKCGDCNKISCVCCKHNGGEHL